jgi:hypothetical protein
LTHVVLDLSGRAHLSCDLQIPAQRIGTFDTELVEHFFMSFANTSGARGSVCPDGNGSIGEQIMAQLVFTIDDTA